jgi:hypothetical protein
MTKTVDKKDSLRCIKYLTKNFRALSYGGGSNLCGSLVDPDQDPLNPYIFGPPGSGSAIICTDPDLNLDPDPDPNPSYHQANR